MIRIENASLAYPGSSELLSQIQLSAGSGELIALVGRNGSGKSTLLRSLLGLMHFEGGQCFLKDIPIDDYSPRKRARIMSYVSSQLSGLPPVTVRELVSLGRMPHISWSSGLKSQDHKKVEEAIREVGLEELADRKVDRLSDGEKQRVMIARALSQDTPVMILDEPAAFLDIHHKFLLMNLLLGFREKGKTLIFSTHDLETAMMSADKFWVIHEKKVVEGSPEDLGIAGLYHKLFGESDVEFNALALRFRIKSPFKGDIGLKGEEGLLKIWTFHALERLGFRIVDDYSGLWVKLKNKESDPIWELLGPGFNEEYGSILELAAFLHAITGKEGQ